MSKIQRLRAVLTGVAAAALAVASLPALATTASAASDQLSGQAGPVTISPVMATDTDTPTPPAGTTEDYFLRHPVLSWQPITSLPVTRYQVEVSPNAEFTNNTVTLPNGGFTVATQYDLPDTLPHSSYFWRVRGEDAAGHATLWTGATEGDLSSHWQFAKSWWDIPTGLSPAANSNAGTSRTFSWDASPDASAYQFEVSTASSFPSADPSQTTWECSTDHTSITPFMTDTYDTDTGLPDSPVAGGACGDTDHLMAKLQFGGQWYWRVRAIAGTVAQPTPAQGAGSCFSDGTQCTAWSDTTPVTFGPQNTTAPGAGTLLADPANLTTGCTSVLAGGTIPLCYDTPTLNWSAVPTANAYKVIVDTEGSIYHSYITFSNSFTPRDSYFDNASGVSYRWYVQACFYTPGGSSQSLVDCGNGYDGVYFHKASTALPTTPASATSTPGHDGLYVTADNNETFGSAVRQVHGQQLTFHWDDYLDYTRQAGIQSTQEAKEYRLQYTTDGDWTTATTIDTDATHWTKQDGFLPDGGYSWRVAPVDGSDNLLAWSAPATVTKGTVAPTVTIAETGLLAPTSAVNLVFATPVTGVNHATLGLQEVGGGKIPGTIVYPSTGPTTATFRPTSALLPGERVEPWVTAAVQDVAGNSAKVTPGSSEVDPTVDSAAPTIHERWSQVSTGHASGGSYAKSASVNDTLQFAFTGTQYSVMGIRTNDGGYASILVDGVPKKTVNFYAHTTAYNVTLFSGTAPSGHHVVTVQVKGAHANGSKGNAVNIDALKYTGHVVQQTSATQAWSVHRSTDAKGGSYLAEAGYLSSWHGSEPTVTTTFSGSGINVLGCKAPDAGYLGVYVDGTFKGMVDSYQSYTACNRSLIHVTGLGHGAHTLTVVASGSHDSRSHGSKVSVDSVYAG